ncbi:MAG: ROK family protein [Balneolaceae bacterium]|jgi:polyphosphate glucokinase
MEVLGIDIGSYGIKGCIVDTKQGKIISDKKSTSKLKDTSPHKILSKMHQLVSKDFNWNGPVGCAFPAPVINGVVVSATRIHDSWTDTDARHLLSEITETDVSVINDSDASGLAEMKFGAGVNHKGVVIMLTVGTGIGSAIFVDGKLLPNSELGSLEIRGITAEERASNRVRKEEGLRKKRWATRMQFVLESYQNIFHPDLFIIGGQMSKKADKVFPYIKIKTPVKAAVFQNEASIVGAAMFAANQKESDKTFYI